MLHFPLDTKFLAFLNVFATKLPFFSFEAIGSDFTSSELAFDSTPDDDEPDARRFGVLSVSLLDSQSDETLTPLDSLSSSSRPSSSVSASGAISLFGSEHAESDDLSVPGVPGSSSCSSSRSSMGSNSELGRLAESSE